jgi:hypothetical protein
MMGSTKRLENTQDKRYGDQRKYQEYIRSVAVLFPLRGRSWLNDGSMILALTDSFVIYFFKMVSDTK